MILGDNKGDETKIYKTIYIDLESFRDWFLCEIFQFVVINENNQLRIFALYIFENIAIIRYYINDCVWS